MSVIAITGGTGFVGGHVVARALAAGHHVRALTRRAQPARPGVTWIEGALDRPESLQRLTDGADAVLHIAGVVNAADRAGFAAGNIDGTAAMLAATTQAGLSRFVHVSSLSAREPGLSDYGWSKAEGDRLVRETALDWTIVRPPAIYGPGDHDLLQMFRMAARGIVPTPPAGRFSTIHVADLAALLVTLAQGDVARATYEVDDETPGGWNHPDFARALGRAVGRRVFTFATPRPLLSLAARAARLVQRDAARLTADRVAYFCHPDWTVATDRRPPPALWRPAIAPSEGLADTAKWYRAQGLL